MNRFLHILLFLLICFTNSNAQKPIWDLILNNADRDEVNNVDDASNFYFQVYFQDSIALNNTPLYSQDSNLLFGKVDDCGNLIWTAILSSNYIIPIDIEIDQQYNSYFVVYNGADTANYRDADNEGTLIIGKGTHILKLNTEGKFIWSRQIQADIYTVDARGVELLIDNEDNLYLYTDFKKTIVSGDSMLSNTNEESSLGCIKFNSDGTILYIKDIASCLENNGGHPSLLVYISKAHFDEASNSLYILVDFISPRVKIQSDTLTGNGGYSVILQLDKNSEVKKKLYSKNKGSPNIKSYIKLFNGDFIIGGAYSINNDSNFNYSLHNNGEFDVFLARIDSTGKPIWHKEYGGTDYDYFSDLLLNNDGSYFYAYFLTEGDITVEGNYLDGNKKNHLLTKHTIDGNNTWVRVGYGGYRYRGFREHLSITPNDEIYYSDWILKGADYQFDCYALDNNTKTHRLVYLKLADTDTSIFCDISKCPNSEIEIKPTLSGKTYQWSTGEETRSIIVDTAGTYTITLNTGVCTYIDSIKITDDNIEVPVSLGSDTFFCEGTDINLTVATTATIYKWNTNETSKAITINEEGQYTIIVTQNGCTGKDTINIASIPYPILNLGQDTAVCFEDGSYNLVTDGSADKYLWSTGETTSLITINDKGTYKVVASNNNSCISEDEIFIEDGCGYTLFIPTVFRAGSIISINSTFKPIGNRITYLKLTVSSRWGEVLYIGENDKAEWDGNYNGTPAMVGQYLYIIEYKAKGNTPGEIIEGTKAGTFLLLR